MTREQLERREALVMWGATIALTTLLASLAVFVAGIVR